MAHGSHTNFLSEISREVSSLIFMRTDLASEIDGVVIAENTLWEKIAKVSDPVANSTSGLVTYSLAADQHRFL